MPLLDLDLQRIADEQPELLPPAALHQPVWAQVALLAATCGSQGALHRSAMDALDALRGPHFVNLDALRVTLQLCKVGAGLPADEWEFHVCALGRKSASAAGHLVGKWPRNASGRWLLQVTAKDVRGAVATERAGRPPA